MLIYQKTTETDKLNILFNVNESAEITTPGDIVLAKTIIGEAPNTESVVSASFASIDSTLEITGSSTTTTGNNLVISGQAELTGGSNVTISATLTLPIIDDSTSNILVCRDDNGQINLPKQVGEQGSTPGDEQAVSKEFVEEFTDSSYVALKSGTSESYSNGVSVVYGGVTNGSTGINALKQIPIAFMKDNLVLTPNTGDSADDNTMYSAASKWNTMLGKGNYLDGGSGYNANTENLVFGGKNTLYNGVQDSATFGYRNQVYANQALTHGYKNTNKGGESFVQGTENQLLGTISIDTGGDGASSDTKASAVIGNKNIIQPGLKHSLVVGSQNTVNSGCQQIITIGLKNKIGKSCSWTNTFGDSNEVKNYATDSTVFGYDNKIWGGSSSTPVQYVYEFGRHNDNAGNGSNHSYAYMLGDYLNTTKDHQVVVGCCNTGDATEANAFFVVGTGTLGGDPFGTSNTPKTTFLVEDSNVKVNGTLTVGSTSLTEGLLQNTVEAIESSSAGQLKYTNIAGITTTVNINGWDNKIGSLTAGSFITITGSGDSRTIAVTGLGTAATYSSDAFATSAQGTKADNAIQSIAESTVNGQIKFTKDGSTYTEIAVHGLGTAAYQNTEYFLAAGATAVNASSLGGQSPAYYAQASSIVQADWNADSGLAQILNKPTIPAAQVNSDWNASSGVSQILNKPTLATVATSGSYGDLSNKPSIPTVSNATITIKQSGRSDQTFTLNGNAATITLNDTTYSAATTTTQGLMSAADKTKLDACIELDGGNYYLKAGNVRTKIADIVAQIRCFREDTSYVTMYDGTTKLISEVKPGDSVLGYDVNKQDYCEALVVSNDRTGEVTTFDCYVFEDGTTVDIDGIDSFLTHYMSNFEGLEPDFTDCFNVSPIDYLYNDSRERNHYFRKIIKSTGGKDNGVAVIYRRKYNCATPTGRYRIQTSNGTCFINGLCHARKPIDTVINFTTGTTAFTPKIREVFANIFARQAKGDPFLPDDHIEDTSAAGLLKELTANNAVINLKKEYLNSTDYKAMKYAEGALSEEEWLPIKTNRIAAREEINTREARNDEILPLLKASNPNLMNTYDNKYWWVENIERAMLGFAELNGLLEDFREYLQQK